MKSRKGEVSLVADTGLRIRLCFYESGSDLKSEYRSGPGSSLFLFPA